MTNDASDLKRGRLERLTAYVRLGAGPFALVQGLLVPAPFPVVSMVAATVLTMSAATVLVASARDLSRVGKRWVGPLVFAVDALCVAGIVVVYAGPGYLSWFAFIFIILSGASRWGVRGAIAGYVAFLFAAAPVEVVGPAYTGYHGFSAGSLTFKLGLMAVAAGFFGMIYRSQRQAEDALTRSEASFRSLFADNPHAMWIYDVETLQFLEVNDAAVERYGYSRDQFLSMRITDIRPSEDIPRLLENLRLERADFDRAGGWRHQLKDGRVIDVDITSHTLTFGDRAACLVLAQDVTERHRAEEALRGSEAHVRMVLDNVAEGIVTLDDHGVIESINPAARRLFHYTPEAIVGRNVRTLIPDRAHAEFGVYLSNRMRPGKNSTSGSLETVGRRKDGSTFPLEFSASAVDIDGRRKFIGTLRDISERKAQTLALEYQALHDSLTGLPNRTLFNDRLEQAILAADREGSQLGLLLMDMDQFKEINDTLGHQAGDQLLQDLATRLRAGLRQSDTVARLGGDEFGVLPAVTGIPAGAVGTAQKILQVLEEPFSIDGQLVDGHVSIGIAIYPDHGTDAGSLMRCADVAMYVAKRAKSGYAVYTPSHAQHSSGRLALQGELRTAVERGELALHYQPVVELATGRVSGVEALARWNHPRLGFLSPNEFIFIAEQSDVIRSLTRWVLGASLTQLRLWRDAGFNLGMSINLSARSLHDQTLVETVERLLANTETDPHLLTLEVTESTIMASPGSEVLERLHALGVNISIDDFGTGYSSLSYLKRLPVSELKIDKIFVESPDGASKDASLLRPIIELGHSVGLRLVAEGVEDSATMRLLLQYGCDFAQGYHISQPLSAPALTTWLLAQEGMRVGLDRLAG